ncbi:MAG: hypothetical protein GWM90_10400 [Gemmatimonadetes bacterium]|nr:hypothetical protein [Gemmatimonadota bacterium]NIQ54363.1 hypothetical protein [Gemmatimonadota bacterium]NIU74577.1 hypothetical protein [Gammaproteobacteria bacterium]NIX44513.1 hypothetical protein [Gemmatimonadota bacterium]NIY08740.1 hypothetical protein [Gemmatimonadota bacterium]
MSSDVPDPTDGALPEEYHRLESAVYRLLEEVAGYKARTQVAEDRAAELERALRDLGDGALDPVQMRDGLRDLEKENQELRRRLVGARDRIRRLVARFDFLREEL